METNPSYSVVSFQSTQVIPCSLELSVNEIKANISSRFCFVTLIIKHMIHKLLLFRCALRPRRSHWQVWTAPQTDGINAIASLEEITGILGKYGNRDDHDSLDRSTAFP